MKKTLIAAALVLFTGSALAEQNAVLQLSLIHISEPTRPY